MSSAVSKELTSTLFEVAARDALPSCGSAGLGEELSWAVPGRPPAHQLPLTSIDNTTATRNETLSLHMGVVFLG